MESEHFIWKPEYAVNIRLFDEQHQKLFKTIDDLYQAILKSEGKKILNNVFGDLNAYVEKHFADEEKYFKDFDYPEAASHVALHEKFRKDVANMESMAAQEESPYELLLFLENWWINHILDVDKRYSAFFNEHGLK